MGTNLKSTKSLFITPNIFKEFPEIIAAISTRNGNNTPPYFFNLSYKVGDDNKRVTENRKQFFSALGISEERIVFQKQIHSDICSFVTSPGFIPASDAVYTNCDNLYLTITVADCIPILMYSPETKVISAVHAGWRGTMKKILLKTISSIRKHFNIELKNLRVYVGPGISVKNFKVGYEVAEQFPEQYVIQNNGKFFIDLKRYNYNQLIESGVSIKHIEISPLCTFDEVQLCHSYRRDKEFSGRMIALIGRRF
ncbi:MAG: peptidoglycan editing factor PgeF [Ignavibacteria bacterium]